MTRFESELFGFRGDFWKADAQKRLDKVVDDYENGRITVDENGVARNCIGRILMEDLAEILELSFCCDTFDREATRIARDEEIDREIAEYKRNYKGPSEEDLNEMRAAFGEGATIVDVISGETITL